MMIYPIQPGRIAPEFLPAIKHHLGWVDPSIIGRARLTGQQVKGRASIKLIDPHTNSNNTTYTLGPEELVFQPALPENIKPLLGIVMFDLAHLLLKNDCLINISSKALYCQPINNLGV